MSSVNLESWDKEHFNMLETIASKSFTMRHYVSIADLQVKHVGRLKQSTRDSLIDKH